MFKAITLEFDDKNYFLEQDGKKIYMVFDKGAINEANNCVQCCQLSHFVAKFSNFSDNSNFFFKKHLATNLAICFLFIWQLLISDSDN